MDASESTEHHPDILEVRKESREEATNSLLASAQTNEQLAIWLRNLAFHNFAMGSLDFQLMSEAADRLKSYS